MSHPQVVVHVPGSAAGIGCRGSCARGRRECQEPSLRPPWMVWAAAGSAFILHSFTWIHSAQVSYWSCLSVGTEQLQGLDCLPLTWVVFFATGLISGCTVESGTISDEALWAFCLLFYQLLLVLFCDVSIWNVLHENSTRSTTGKIGAGFDQVQAIWQIQAVVL